MKLITQKQLFLVDSIIIKRTIISVFPQISRLLLVLLLFFSSGLFLNINGTNFSINSYQVPAKTKVKAVTIKANKSKGKKVKKNVLMKKDTLREVDPASTNSPLYNH